MSAPRLEAIWRYPLKSHGRERLEAVELRPDRPLPHDRRWAVAHEAARVAPGRWAPCVNFSRGSKAPALMAIEARFDEARGELTLTHPDRPALTFRPDDPEDAARFLEWVRPLVPADRAAPAAIVALPERGFTDTDYPSVSINCFSSLRALGQKLGRELDPRRFRGNLWIEGTAPWEEFDWIGRRLRIGEAELEVEERIGRCLATTANPETGRRDADTLGALQDGWGHRDFGVYARVVRGGRVAIGDRVEVL